MNEKSVLVFFYSQDFLEIKKQMRKILFYPPEPTLNLAEEEKKVDIFQWMNDFYYKPSDKNGNINLTIAGNVILVSSAIWNFHMAKGGMQKGIEYYKTHRVLGTATFIRGLFGMGLSLSFIIRIIGGNLGMKKEDMLNISSVMLVTNSVSLLIMGAIGLREIARNKEVPRGSTADLSLDPQGFGDKEWNAKEWVKYYNDILLPLPNDNTFSPSYKKQHEEILNSLSASEKKKGNDILKAAFEENLTARFSDDDIEKKLKDSNIENKVNKIIYDTHTKKLKPVMFVRNPDSGNLLHTILI